MENTPPATIFFDLGDTLITRINGQWQPWNDALDTLKALKESGYRLGLISDWPDGTTVDEVHAFLKELGLDTDIEQDLITISSEIPGNVMKPNKQIFDLALKKGGYLSAGDESIFVTEDSSHIAAARTYGWRAILKRNTGTCRPDDGECVSHLSELPNIL